MRSEEQIKKAALESKKHIADLLEGKKPAVDLLASAVVSPAADAKTFVPSFQPSRSYKPAGATPKSEGFHLSSTVKTVVPKKDLAANPENSDATTATGSTDLKAGGVALDPWQQEAVDVLMSGGNVVVDAPTSAGKTRVIEALIDRRWAQGFKLIYTSPVKSLSNDKYREFCEKYGRDAVGINTGDFKENLGAPIILATLETYRNSLIGVEPNMSRRVVVYDEYHYLQDESRGSAWEESIVLTPKESQLILLSASVPNAEDFAEWIQDLFQKETRVIRITKRPVPLIDCIFTKWGWILGNTLNLNTEECEKLKRALLKSKPKPFLRQKEEQAAVQAPIQLALESGMGPIVLYAGRRASVESLAISLSKSIRAPYPPEEQQALHERIRDLSGWEYVPSELQKLILKFGIAYHHSGMIPPGRVAVETLLKEGLLRVCTGTMGISLGVNFAVRSAAVSDQTRPGEGGESTYSNSEILQMLGRAGRRGRDTQGFSLWMNPGRYALQRPRERERCESSLKFDPTTVLGLLGQKESLSELSDFYQKSFFMRNKKSSFVLVKDHDLMTGHIYQEMGSVELNCKDIPKTHKTFLEGKRRSQIPCTTCTAQKVCHKWMSRAGESTLSKIVEHLQKVGALEGSKPTKFGQIARHFPQSGGLIIASWISAGTLGSHNYRDLLQAMAYFCAAHFKEVPDTFSNANLLSSLKVPTLIEKFYPEELFPELYDDNKRNFSAETEKSAYREYNPGAASLVVAWVERKLPWETLVQEHSSKHFSAGDCMMVLFRFATFLQSCVRMEEQDPNLCAMARASLKVLLRDPLDARNRMLADEIELESVEVPSDKVTKEGETEPASDDVTDVTAPEAPQRPKAEPKTGTKMELKAETLPETAVPKGSRKKMNLFGRGNTQP